jgi:hypothetical protein
MLASATALIDKATELARCRMDRQAPQDVASLADALYLALKAVHQDYLSVFECVARGLAQDMPLRDIAAILLSRRHEEEAERHAILKQAWTFAERDALHELHPFFQEVVHYFEHSPLAGDDTPTTLLMQALLLASLADRNSAGDARSRLALANKISLYRLRAQWELVAGAYQSLHEVPPQPRRVPDESTR